MSPRKRTSPKKRHGERLHTSATDVLLSPEEVDIFLFPEKRRARAHDLSGRESSEEAVRRRFPELERHFQRD
jgi:hypothetical protein